MTELFCEIKIGAAAPFEIIHLSDTHLTLADERDDERKIRLAKHRFGEFSRAEGNIETAVALSKRESIPIMSTGDLIDFVSHANLDALKKYTSSADIFACAGNHEFSLYVGEAWEDEAYRNQSLGKVQAAHTNDIRFSSRLINGVNFVAVDNSYYLFEEKQLAGLKAEVDRGFPVVLMIHVPLYTPDLYDHMINVLGHGDAALMSVPEHGLRNYSEHRYKQQKENEITHEAFEYIMGEPGIKLILTGHLHFDYESVLRDGLPQIVTGTDTLRRIRFI